MGEQICFIDPDNPLNNGDCSTFALGWHFPYRDFFQKGPERFFRNRGDSIITQGEEQTGDVVFFLSKDVHVAIAIQLEDGFHYLSQLGFRGKIALTDLETLTDKYGAISLIVRKNS